jgi:hypothetical protein
LRNIGKEESKKSYWYESYEEIAGLFDEKQTYVATKDIAEKNNGKVFFIKSGEKPKWSFYILISNKGDDPLIFAIKYVGKKRFLRKEQDRKYIFEQYLLPKFAFIIQNAQYRIQSQHKALILAENRERLSHEIGQIAIGIRGLDFYYNSKIEEYKDSFAKGMEKNNGDMLKKSHSEFLSKVELHRGDVGGQFEIIEMLVKVHGDDYIPNPRRFNLWKEFMNRWHFIFFDACHVDSKYLELPFGKDVNQELQEIVTDPILLQCALYNIVNNAIKYSLVNTRITVTLEKNIDPEEYIFSVSNFGAYLDPKDESIYKKGIRYPEMKGLVSSKKDYIVPGEGVGLYWSKMLIENKLRGKITHTCSEKDKPICKYNIPLMKPLFARYQNYSVFRELWNRKKQLGIIRVDIPEPSYEEIKEEYERLIRVSGEKSEYDRIVTKWEDKRLQNIGFSQLSTDIVIPTYQVTFTIKIPKMEERNESQYSFY